MKHSGPIASHKSNAIHKSDLPNRPNSVLFNESRLLDIRGDKGVLKTDVLVMDDLGISVGKVQSTGHRVWLRDEANIIFLLPLAGRLELDISGTLHKANNRKLTAFLPTERVTSALPDVFGRFHAITLQVTAEKVRSLFDAQEIGLASAFRGDGTPVTSSTAQYVIQLLPHLVDDLLSFSPRQIPIRVLAELGNLIEELLVQMADSLPPKAPPRRALSSLHRVRLADDILRTRFDETVSLLEIARELGISLRSLQLGYKEVYGTSPRGALERLRMENARSRLIAATEDDAVTKIAMDCGFFHLSRFSQSYAQRFGERPSETLARQRRHRL